MNNKISISILILFLVTLLLSGCSDTLSDLKNAVSGINSKANEAATAISVDVHSLRETKLTYEDTTFTINDLFKNTIRDVQWIYNKKAEQLQVKGTWLPGLFESYGFTNEEMNSLKEKGKVFVTLSFDEGELIERLTKVEMQVDNQKIVDDSGKSALQLLYEAYIE